METGRAQGSPTFGVQGRYTGGVTELYVAGRLVAGHGAGHPVWQTASDWRGASRLVVDLAGVSALDAGGLGALLRLRQSACRHGVPVMVRRAGPRVRRLLQLTGLDSVFGLAADTDRTTTGLAGVLLSRCA
jgi:anti-anti-sigma factor